jgi:hypothetical protein
VPAPPGSRLLRALVDPGVGLLAVRVSDKLAHTPACALPGAPVAVALE